MKLSKREKIEAIYAFSAGWHNGQWTRLYRLSCACQRWLQRHGGLNVKAYLSDRQEALIVQLERKYGDE